MLTATALLVQLHLGKWRYFITGAALAVLFGLICRGIGRLFAPFQAWRCFSGTCTAALAQNGKYLLTVRFTDSSRLNHTAAFYTDSPEAAKLTAGDSIRIAVRREVFASGAYPQNPAEASENRRDIVPHSVYAGTLRRQLLREFAVQLIICGLAFAIFLAAMRICFPPT